LPKANELVTKIEKYRPSLFRSLGGRLRVKRFFWA